MDKEKAPLLWGAAKKGSPSLPRKRLPRLPKESFSGVVWQAFRLTGVCPITAMAVVADPPRVSFPPHPWVRQRSEIAPIHGVYSFCNDIIQHFCLFVNGGAIIYLLSWKKEAKNFRERALEKWKTTLGRDFDRGRCALKAVFSKLFGRTLFLEKGWEIYVNCAP